MFPFAMLPWKLCENSFHGFFTGEENGEMSV